MSSIGFPKIMGFEEQGMFLLAIRNSSFKDIGFCSEEGRVARITLWMENEY